MSIYKMLWKLCPYSMCVYVHVTVVLQDEVCSLGGKPITSLGTNYLEVKIRQSLRV